MSGVFDPTIPPTRYAGNPIFDLGEAASWWVSQFFDPCILDDPADPSRLLMFASGMAAPAQTGIITIGRFYAAKSNPYVWTDDGVVLPRGGGGSWDVEHVRLGSVMYANGTFYLFYTGISGSGAVGQIGLATSTDGLTFTKHASNPLITPNGNGRDDGDYVSEPAVLKEGSAWTLIYSYRDGGTTMPGLRFATSSDGVSWTKGGAGDILTTSPQYAEFHQLLKIGRRYWLIYEQGNTGTPFTINAAYNDTDPRSAFTNIANNPVLQKTSGVGDFDRYHVATPHLSNLASDGRWRLYYQGAGTHDQPYGTNTWPGGVAEFQPFSTASRSV